MLTRLVVGARWILKRLLLVAISSCRGARYGTVQNLSLMLIMLWMMRHFTISKITRVYTTYRWWDSKLSPSFHYQYSNDCATLQTISKNVATRSVRRCRFIRRVRWDLNKWTSKRAQTWLSECHTRWVKPYLVAENSQAVELDNTWTNSIYVTKLIGNQGGWTEEGKDVLWVVTRFKESNDNRNFFTYAIMRYAIIR